MKNKIKAFTLSCKTFRSDIWSAMLRSRNTMSSQPKFHSYGFTLAEVIIVLTILGIIAMITVPSLVRHQNEVAERTKLKKIWKMYDQVIQNMAVENDLVGEDALKKFAEDDNCGNCRKYFRASKYAEDDNYCVFKTHDGVWMNISDILHPTVTLDKNNEQTDYNTFTMVTRYDSTIRAFRTNDANYSGLTNDEKAALKNFFSKMDIESNLLDVAISKWVNNFSSQCFDFGVCAYYKSDYDINGNMITDYYECNASGNDCAWSYKYDYDSNGNMIAQYNCDGSGNNCYESYKFDYDSNGNKISEYFCDGSGNNCNGSEKYDYDSNGNQIAVYSFCDGSGNNCSYSSKSDYDSNGNKIVQYNRCDSNGNNCRSSSKYAYDSNGNRIAQYYGCDGSGNNCSSSQKYAYDSNGNKIAYYSGCDASGNNCSSSYKYDYDSNGNMIVEHRYCDGSGNNCSELNKYDYDSNGNMIAEYLYCDSSGNNCETTYNYSYTEIK